MSSQETDGGGDGGGGGSGGGHHHNYQPSASFCFVSVKDVKQENFIACWNVLFRQCLRNLLALGVFQEFFLS